MESTIRWTGGMCFEAEQFVMDAIPPIGNGKGMNPKEVLLSSLAACAGMDILGFLKKRKHQLERFNIKASANLSKNKYPQVFTSIFLAFEFTGLIYFDDAIKAVELSQTKYSGISAMLCRAVPINWVVIVDGEIISQGKASFESYDDFYLSGYEG